MWWKEESKYYELSFFVLLKKQIFHFFSAYRKKKHSDYSCGELTRRLFVLPVFTLFIVTSQIQVEFYCDQHDSIFVELLIFEEAFKKAFYHRKFIIKLMM